MSRFGAPGPERGFDSMRWDKVTQLAARHPVSLPGAFDRASDDMPGHEGENDGMLPHRGVLSVLRNRCSSPAAAVVSQSWRPGAFTSGGQPGGTYRGASRSTMRQ